jgi:predicted DNA-binding ArsR family transcriptional regulator
MKDQSLAGKSQQLYDQTQANYKEMISRMDTAAASMTPVLEKFNDRVLFIKANLNAQAIASLKGTEVELGGDIDKLIKDMQTSIDEADKFISGLEGKKG